MGPVAKGVLVAMASFACRECGLAWPGIPLVMEHVEASERAVRYALEELVKAGHLEIHAYSKGGRHRSTQYRVLPGLTNGTPCPCVICIGKAPSSPTK